MNWTELNFILLKNRDERNSIFAEMFTLDVCLALLLDTEGTISNLDSLVHTMPNTNNLEHINVQALPNYGDNGACEPISWNIQVYMTYNSQFVCTVSYDVTNAESMNRLNSLYSHFESQRSLRSLEQFKNHLSQVIKTELERKF